MFNQDIYHIKDNFLHANSQLREEVREVLLIAYIYEKMKAKSKIEIYPDSTIRSFYKKKSI